MSCDDQCKAEGCKNTPADCDSGRVSGGLGGPCGDFGARGGRRCPGTGRSGGTWETPARAAGLPTCCIEVGWGPSALCAAGWGGDAAAAQEGGRADKDGAGCGSSRACWGGALVGGVGPVKAAALAGLPSPAGALGASGTSSSTLAGLPALLRGSASAPGPLCGGASACEHDSQVRPQPILALSADTCKCVVLCREADNRQSRPALHRGILTSQHCLRVSS